MNKGICSVTLLRVGISFRVPFRTSHQKKLTLTLSDLRIFFPPEPLRQTGIKGSKCLINKTVETSPQTPTQHQSSLNATKMKEIVRIEQGYRQL